MRRWLTAMGVAGLTFALASEAGAGEGGFSFAGDKAGQLLERLLRPGEKATASAATNKPAPGALSRLDQVETPLTPVSVEPPRAKAEVGGRAAPRAPGEGALPATVQPARPAGVTLPPGVRVRLPGIDVNHPIPLPLLGTAQPDRAPLTDPTTAASLAAALAQSIPSRSAPAVFLRLAVPDPFENSHAVRVRTPLPENPAPPAAEPRRPGR